LSLNANVRPQTPARLTLARKGWLVVGVPVVFQLILLALLFMMQRAHDREVSETRRSRELISSSYRALGLLTDAETGVRGYALTGESRFAEPYNRALQQLPAEFEHLRSLASATPQRSDDISIADLQQAARNELAYDRQAIDAIQRGRRSEVAAPAAVQVGKNLMDGFRTRMDQFLAHEQDASNERERSALLASNEISFALIAGGTLDILLAAAAVLFFTRSITSRMRVVVANMRRLERNEPLQDPVSGTDEIADFDKQFHDLAEALRQSDEQWRRAEDSLRRFFTISLEMLCIAGFDGFFKLLNPVWEKRLGHPLRVLYSQPFIDFVHPDDKAATIAESQRLAEGATVIQFENRYRTADGSYRWLLWNAAAHVETQTIFAAASDITERKEIEGILAGRNQALELANRDLESFTYSVSHDLRSPLRAVDGYARMLEEDYARSLDDEGRRLLSVIRAEAKRMGVLIDDLLSFSRLGRQALARAEVNLGEIASEIIAVKRQRYPNKSIEFVAHDAPVARVDRGAIRHVLFNLIANAVKYAKPGESVHIEFGGRADGDSNLYWVRDDGIGFDMRYADKIFGVFQRLHTSAEIEGTGVGLAIVHRIIERHGGRIWAESEPGKGSTFFFTLPIAAEAIDEMEAVNE
jgi:PAS domain S-box-containing protein